MSTSGHAGQVVRGALTSLPRCHGPCHLSTDGPGARVVSAGSMWLLSGATRLSVLPGAGWRVAVDESSPHGLRPWLRSSLMVLGVTGLAQELATGGRRRERGTVQGLDMPGWPLHSHGWGSRSVWTPVSGQNRALQVPLAQGLPGTTYSGLSALLPAGHGGARPCLGCFGLAHPAASS